MALLAPKDRIQKAAQEYAARHGVNMHEFWNAFDEKAKLDKEWILPKKVDPTTVLGEDPTDVWSKFREPTSVDIPSYPLAPPNQVEIPPRLLRSGFRQFSYGIDTGHQTTDPATLLGMDPTEAGSVLGVDPIRQVLPPPVIPVPAAAPAAAPAATPPADDFVYQSTPSGLSPLTIPGEPYEWATGLTGMPPTPMQILDAQKKRKDQPRLDKLYEKFKDAANEGLGEDGYVADPFDQSVKPTYDRDHFKAEILSIIYPKIKDNYDLIGSTYVHKLTKRQLSQDVLDSMKPGVLKAYNEFLARYQEEFKISPPHYLRLNKDERAIPAAAPAAAPVEVPTASGEPGGLTQLQLTPAATADDATDAAAAAAADKLEVDPSTTQGDIYKSIIDAHNLTLLPQQTKTIYEVGVDRPKFVFNALANRHMGRAAETPAMQNNINYWYPIRRGEWYLASLDLRKPEHNYAGMNQEERDKHGWAGWNMTGYGITDKAGKAAFYNKDVQKDSWNLLVKLGFMTEPPSATLQAGLHEYNLSDHAIWQSIHYGSAIDKQNQIDAARVRGGITGRGEHGKRREIGLMHFVKQWEYDQQFVPPEEKIGLAAYLSEKVGGPWAVTRQPTPPDYVTPSTYQTQTQDTLLGQDPTEPWGIDDPNQTNLGPGILSTNFGTTRSDFLARRQRGDPLYGK